jgi:thioredoxin 1
VKLDVDANPNAATQFGVRGIPTMILFKGGKEVERLVGNQPKDAIVSMLSRHS